MCVCVPLSFDYPRDMGPTLAPGKPVLRLPDISLFSQGNIEVLRTPIYMPLALNVSYQHLSPVFCYSWEVRREDSRLPPRFNVPS